MNNKILLILLVLSFSSFLSFSQRLEKFYSKNGLTGLKDINGLVIVKAKYNTIRDFSEGYAAISLNNKWGFINTKGFEAVDIIYEKVRDFNYGYAQVLYMGEWHSIKIDGNKIIPVESSNSNELTNDIEYNEVVETLEYEVKIDDIKVDETTEVEVVEVEEEDDNTVFQFAVIEEKPEFPGGQKALLAYIVKNTKYPVIAKENGVKGTVFVQFVIEKDGTVSNVKPARKVDSHLDKEACRVVKSMAAWKPGKQRGKTVRIQYIVPVKFVLHSN